MHPPFPRILNRLPDPTRAACCGFRALSRSRQLKGAQPVFRPGHLLRVFAVFIFIVLAASASFAQTATVTAVTGPTAPYFTDDVFATVTVTSAAAPVPTGTITWSTDGGSQQTASLTNGVARIEMKFFAPGSHGFSYAYSGDGTYAAVAAQSLSFSVSDRAFTTYGSEHRLSLGGPSQYWNVAVDTNNNLLVPDQIQNKLFEFTPYGVESVIPTTGLNGTSGIVLDKQNNIFLADTGNARVLEITAASVQSTLPITGLSSPVALAFDPAYQTLYVVDENNETIIAYNVAGQTQTSFSPAITNLTSVAVDSVGNIYYSQGDNTVDTGHLYRRDSSGNVVEIFTGVANINGVSLDAKGDIVLSCGGGIFLLDPQSHLTQISPVHPYSSYSASAVDSRGRIYVPAGAYLTEIIPGTGGDVGFVSFQGADDSATPIATQGGNDLYVNYQAPYNQLFTALTVPNNSPFTPTRPGNFTQTGYTLSPTGTPFLLEADLFAQPTPAGNFSSYVTITTTDNSTHTNLISGTNINSTFGMTPGTITPGTPGVTSIGGVATDGNGTAYISDTAANTVYQETSTASTALAFTGLNAPTQLGVDALGTVFVLDSGSSRILSLTTSGTQSVAFDLGAQSTLTSLSAFAMDGIDNLYVAGQTSSGQAAIYLFDTAGNQVPIAQNIALPSALALDGFRNIFSVEMAGGNLRRYDQVGNPTLVATGLNQPASLAVDPGGTAFVTGPSGSGVTIVHPDGTTTPYPYTALANASALASDSVGNLVAGDTTAKALYGITRIYTEFSYDFGNVSLGSTATYTGQLFNSGNAPTAVWELEPFLLSETALATGPNECPVPATGSTNPPLASGGYCDFNITFTPTYLGTTSESYIIDLKDTFGNFDDVDGITVTGNGVTPVGAPTIAPNPLNFGNVTVDTTSTGQSILVTNSNNTALTISAIAIGGANAAEFSQSNNCVGVTLNPNNVCSIQVTFSPSMAGAATATITVTDNATSGPSTITIEGVGVTAAGPGTPAAALTPATMNFTTTAGVAAATQVATLTNSGTAALAISSIAVSSEQAGSFTETNNCGTSVAAGASCAITVTFAETTAGSYTATLSVVDNASPTTQFVALTGTVAAVAPPAAPVATLTPTSLSYTATTGTTSAAQTATLTNSGTATLNISGITITGANTSEFAISANTCGATLAVNASCTIAVTFSPDSVASFTAAISVADDAPGSPQTSTLTGTGTAAAAPDFTVTATPSTQSVTAGSAATFSIPVASLGGDFPGAVTLSASGLPSGWTASFSPASVTPGTAGASSTMTVQTAALQQTASNREPSRWPLTAPVFTALLLLIPGWRARKRWNAKVTRTFITGGGCLLVLLGMMAMITGCGAGFAIPGASNTYTITVTGTSGSVQHNTTVQITVK